MASFILSTYVYIYMYIWTHCRPQATSFWPLAWGRRSKISHGTSVVGSSHWQQPWFHFSLPVAAVREQETFLPSALLPGSPIHVLGEVVFIKQGRHACGGHDKCWEWPGRAVTDCNNGQEVFMNFKSRGQRRVAFTFLFSFLQSPLLLD